MFIINRNVSYFGDFYRCISSLSEAKFVVKNQENSLKL